MLRENSRFFLFFLVFVLKTVLSFDPSMHHLYSLSIGKDTKIENQSIISTTCRNTDTQQKNTQTIKYYIPNYW